MFKFCLSNKSDVLFLFVSCQLEKGPANKALSFHLLVLVFFCCCDGKRVVFACWVEAEKAAASLDDGA